LIEEVKTLEIEELENKPEVVLKDGKYKP